MHGHRNSFQVMIKHTYLTPALDNNDVKINYFHIQPCCDGDEKENEAHPCIEIFSKDSIDYFGNTHTHLSKLDSMKKRI